MKKILLLIITTSVVWTQCDANDDGNLDVLDIIDQINCILSNCWDEQDSSIYGFWMIDSATFNMNMYGYTESDTIYCGETDYYDGYTYQQDAFVLNFDQSGIGGEYYLDPSLCGAEEIEITSPGYTWSFTVNGSTLAINFGYYYGYTDISEFTFEIIDENRLILNLSDSYNGATINFIYDFHRVSASSEQYSIKNPNKKKTESYLKRYQNNFLENLSR